MSSVPGFPKNEVKRGLWTGVLEFLEIEVLLPKDPLHLLHPQLAVHFESSVVVVFQVETERNVLLSVLF